MTIQTINPTASAHDAREASGTMSLTTNANVLTSGAHWAGLFLTAVAATAANLNTATLYYKSVDSARDDPNIVWYAHANDDAPVFTTTTNDVSGRARTTASVTDSASNIGTTTYRAVTITSIVAEVLARGGWAAGNDIALIGDCQADCALEYGHYDGGSNVWYVEIDYTTSSNTNESISLGRGHAATPAAVAGVLGSVVLGRGESAAPGGPAATGSTLALGRGDAVALSGVLAAADSIIAAVGRGLALEAVQPDGSATIEVNASYDDGSESTGGSMALTTAVIDTDSVGDIAGLLFRGLNAPNGAGIVTAYIEVYTNDSGRQSPNVNIKGQANPADFTTTANNFSGRTMTTEAVSWVATNIGTGAYKASPSLVSVLQEIVNGGGWSAGGNVALFLIQNGASGWFRFASWNHATDPAPRLIVTWTSGAQAVTESLSLARGGGMELLPAANVLTAIDLNRGSGLEPSPSASVLTALSLARGGGVGLSPSANVLSSIALARGETAAGDGAAGLAAALALARQLDAGATALQGAAGSLALGRGLTAGGDAVAGVGAAVALARQLGLSAAATQAALGALALGRGLGIEPTPATGVLVVMELARAHGVTAADGFTILEAVALGRALGVTAANRVDAAAAVTIALARAIAGDGRAAGAGSVALGMGRALTFQPVTAGHEAVALARALGIAAAPGMALWEAIALSTGRGAGATAALGYLEAVALARRAGVTTAETLAAQEELLLALGNATAVTAALGAAEAIGLERVVGGAWGDVAGLFEAIGIGIYRAVAVNGAGHIVLVTPRHLLIVDAENRVTVIDLESRVYQVQGESNE